MRRLGSAMGNGHSNIPNGAWGGAVPLGYRGSYPEYLMRGPSERVEVDPRAGTVEA